MTPVDLYRNIKVSVHRLESQRHYTVPNDDERQQAFRAGEPLPPMRASKHEDMVLVSELRAAGKIVERVHVVDLPLSPYTQYELAVYPENVAAGEDVYIADRAAAAGLAEIHTDFVVFDPETAGASVLLFDIDEHGAVNGYRHLDDAQTVARCWAQYQLARRHAEPVAAFAAKMSETGR